MPIKVERHFTTKEKMEEAIKKIKETKKEPEEKNNE